MIKKPIFTIFIVLDLFVWPRVNEFLQIENALKQINWQTKRREISRDAITVPMPDRDC